MRDFGKKLKKARQERKLTQGELATVLQVERKTVNSWECDRHTPTAWNALRCQAILEKAKEVKNEKRQKV